MTADPKSQSDYTQAGARPSLLRGPHPGPAPDPHKRRNQGLPLEVSPSAGQRMTAMNNRTFRAVQGVCAVAMAALWAAPAGAQTPEVKEKAPLYSYVGNWAIPRAQWGD